MSLERMSFVLSQPHLRKYFLTCPETIANLRLVCRELKLLIDQVDFEFFQFRQALVNVENQCEGVMSSNLLLLQLAENINLNARIEIPSNGFLFFNFKELYFVENIPRQEKDANYKSVVQLDILGGTWQKRNLLKTKKCYSLFNIKEKHLPTISKMFSNILDAEPHQNVDFKLFFTKTLKQHEYLSMSFSAQLTSRKHVYMFKSVKDYDTAEDILVETILTKLFKKKRAILEEKLETKRRKHWEF